MESILSYYAPNLSLDVNSLRKTAEDLRNQHRNSPGLSGITTDTHVGLDELEDLAIDDEDFTIQNLPDNTTRTSVILLLVIHFGSRRKNNHSFSSQNIPVNSPILTSPIRLETRLMNG